MLTTLDPSALKDCSATPNDHVSTDLQTLTELIFAIAPEAILIQEKGVSVFYLTDRWLFAVAPHQHNLCLYYSADIDMTPFADRLAHAHLGDHCIIINDLDVINLNVLVELLAVVKVDIQRKLTPNQALH